MQNLPEFFMRELFGDRQPSALKLEDAERQYAKMYPTSAPRFFAVGQYAHGEPAVYTGFAGDSTTNIHHVTDVDFVPTEPGRHFLGSSARHYYPADVVCYVEDDKGFVPMGDGTLKVFDDMLAEAMQED
jgi:hypothetical protein